MNRLTLGFSLATALIAAPWLCADDEPASAKELFFNPRRSVAEATAARSSRVTAEDGRRIPQPAPDSAVLGLSYWIELIEPGKRGVHVTDDRNFRSGERIRLHFRSNTNGRIVIVQLGASGGSSVLFPDSGKGLAENSIRATDDHVLPSKGHWFRFDENAGTERLVVLFARTQEALDRTFPTRTIMDARATARLLRAVSQTRGSKDLRIESETEEPSEVGEYIVEMTGRPIAMEIALTHR